MAEHFHIQPSEADNLPLSALWVAEEMMEELKHELTMQEALMSARG